MWHSVIAEAQARVRTEREQERQDERENRIYRIMNGLPPCYPDLEKQSDRPLFPPKRGSHFVAVATYVGCCKELIFKYGLCNQK